MWLYVLIYTKKYLELKFFMLFYTANILIQNMWFKYTVYVEFIKYFSLYISIIKVRKHLYSSNYQR